MRLLEYNNDGEFSLTKDFLDGEIPEYAILSHTWGADTEEVTYRDVIDGTGKNKIGYQKIRFCGEQARRDGLHKFWVDTCCINKSSDRELSEAINSMFRWYRKAAKCYVYLTDVSTNDQIDLSFQPWAAAFANSRWFTRGWTLQELIAPPSVEFFCLNSNRLGDKKSLEGQLHKITGIPVSALQGNPLSEFSFEERISWAQIRETKREEDKAYSLLGILDISMPVIYGEGMEKAFRRLNREWKYQLDELSTISSSSNKQSTTLPFQSSAATSRYVLPYPEASAHDDNLIDNLPYATEAPFNTYQRQHEPPCLEDTRVDILYEIHTWAKGQDDRCIFWLSGLAGTGKSTIARTIARRYFEETSLGASFFFSRGGGDISHAGKFFTSIARQLAKSIPLLNQHICDAVTNNSDIANQSLRDQWQQLILRPLLKLDGIINRSSYVVIVDALDECDGDNDIRMILQLLAEARSLRSVRLRIFLTSRPEIPVRYGLSQIPDTERKDFVLHSISLSNVNHDISIFLEHELRVIGQNDEQEPGWPGVARVQRLVKSAGGLFIWAATACRFIREGQSTEERLCSLLEGGDAPATPEEHLNGIYATVLRSSVQPSSLEQERQRFYGVLRQILGSIVVLSSPLSVKSLSRLLHTTKQKVNQALKTLHAILDIPKDEKCPLRLHHPSFRDFLLNKDRCKDLNFWVDDKQAHRTLVDSCIRLMSISLKQDICDLNIPGLLVTEVEASRVQYFIAPEVQYASLYWIQHLHRSGTQLHDNDQVHQLLHKHFLHWLEALGWMGKVSEGIYAIAVLESIALASDCPELCAFIHDMKRFALYNKQLIDQAPLQVYYSALVFTPMMSRVRKNIEDRLPQWIQQLPKIQRDWSAALQTLEGHRDSVNSVAFSHDSKLLASASRDNTVKVWDAATGTLQQTLEGHSGWVNSVAFLHDSKLLASASIDKTVKVWDAATGTLQQTLEGHSDWVNSVAFSHDSKLLASASIDKTVKVWDAATGTLQQTLEGHSNSVNSVAFSHDSKLLASASGDKTVKVWDAATGTLQQMLEGHSDWVRSVAFSHDSKLLASASDDKTVKVWDAATGTLQQTLKGHSNWVSSVTFSHDSKLLASASIDKTVNVWDAATGTLQQTLEGHSNWVNSVAFSHGSKLLASASDDKTVKVWDAATGTLQQTLEGHSDWVRSVAFSHNSKLLASASDDETVKVWDAATGTLQQTLKGHSNWVSSVAFSHDSKLLASASRDKTVKVWDAATGTLQQTLQGHSNWVRSVAFSHSSKLLASASDDKTVKVWDAATGTLQQTLEGHSDWVSSVAFSHDSKLLASASKDNTVKVWDAATGTLQQTLEGHSNWVRSVAFSHNSKLLASASGDKTIKVWDAATGTIQQTFAVHSSVWILSFDVTTSILITNIGRFKIAQNGTLPLPISSQELSGESEAQGLGISGPWVRWNDQSLLWLPPDFRAVTSDISLTGSTLGIGCSSGKVFFIGFSISILRRDYV